MKRKRGKTNKTDTHNSRHRASLAQESIKDLSVKTGRFYTYRPAPTEELQGGMLKRKGLPTRRTANAKRNARIQRDKTDRDRPVSRIFSHHWTEDPTLVTLRVKKSLRTRTSRQQIVRKNGHPPLRQNQPLSLKRPQRSKHVSSKSQIALDSRDSLPWGRKEVAGKGFHKDLISLSVNYRNYLHTHKTEPSKTLASKGETTGGVRPASSSLRTKNRAWQTRQLAYAASSQA